MNANYHQPIPAFLTTHCVAFLPQLVRQAVQDIESYLSRRRMAAAARNSRLGGHAGSSSSGNLESITEHAIQSVLWFRRDRDTARVSLDLVCDALNLEPEHLWRGLDRRFANNRETAGQWRRLKHLTDQYLKHEQVMANQTGLLAGRLTLATDLMFELIGDRSSCEKGQVTYWAKHGRYGRRLPVKKHKGKLFTTRRAVEWFFAEVPFQPANRQGATA